MDLFPFLLTPFLCALVMGVVMWVMMRERGGAGSRRKRDGR
jgi:hypothetical protein